MLTNDTTAIAAIRKITERIISSVGTLLVRSLYGMINGAVKGTYVAIFWIILVSDADMCEAIGANGIIRTCIYSTKHNRPFFDRDAWPLSEVTDKNYIRSSSDSAVCHFFEKGLKIHLLMMTEAGKKEATARHNILVDFLRQLFREENAPDWEEFLDKYLKQQIN